MKRFLFAGAALALSAVSAFAAPQSFVSVKGTDAGTCASATAPCRTFAYAHNQTSAGGEILALDAGDYGPVTITKSLSITGAVDGAGVRGGPASAVAITIDAGAAGVVDLTGLTLDGLGSVFGGIEVLSAGQVTVRKCVVRNYRFRGVNLNGVSTRFLVEDIAVANVADDGIACNGACAINRVSINRAGASGIVAFGSATVSEAAITQSGSGTFTSMRLNRSVVTGNTAGLNDVVQSAGDNFVRDNGTNFPHGAPNVVGKQ